MEINKRKLWNWSKLKRPMEHKLVRPLQKEVDSPLQSLNEKINISTLHLNTCEISIYQYACDIRKKRFSWSPCIKTHVKFFHIKSIYLWYLKEIFFMTSLHKNSFEVLTHNSCEVISQNSHVFLKTAFWKKFYCMCSVCKDMVFYLYVF